MMCNKCQSENKDNRYTCWYCDTPLLLVESSSAKDIPSTIAMGYDNQRQPAINTAIKHEFDLHNFSYTFTITSRHSFSKGLEKNMRYWKWHLLETDKYKIAVKPKSLEIFVKKRTFTDKPEVMAAKIEEEVREYAIKFATDNALNINPIPIPIRKEVKIIDFRIAENFRTKNVKSVYPTPSPIEFINPRTAIKDSVQFISEVDKIQDHLNKQTLIMSDFSRNIELHLQVMNNINKSLLAITKVATKPTLIERVSKWLNRQR